MGIPPYPWNQYARLSSSSVTHIPRWFRSYMGDVADSGGDVLSRNFGILLSSNSVHVIQT